MKERPIIMSGDNPKLILEDRKNQTRRLQGLDAINLRPNDWILHRVDGADFTFHKRNAIRARDLIVRCPYGVAGDRLWVRERFTITKQRQTFKARGFPPLYEVTGYRDWHMESFCVVLTASESIKFRKWKRKTGNFPSIFMFKSLSRITLEITKVRVERLQEIIFSAYDLMAEGIIYDADASIIGPCEADAGNLIEPFTKLWDSLHGKGAWDKNPWVWVIEFRLSKETDHAPSPL